MDFMLSTLIIDGVEPFIIGDFHHLGHRFKHDSADEKMIDLLDLFDAATTLPGMSGKKHLI